MATIPPSITTPLPNAAEAAKQIRIVGANDDGTDKEMFLKLMLAQLRNQDPTAPMDQKDMMASITQFSQVEQMQNMAKAMETLSLSQGVGLIGRDIEYTQDVKNEAGQVVGQKTFNGTVESVEQGSGGVKLVLKKPEGAPDSLPPVTIPPSLVTKVYAS